MEVLITILIGLFCLLAYLLVRYLRIRIGLKDSNYGGVQHSLREVPPPPPESLFLPGSRSDNAPTVAEIMQELEKDMKVQKNIGRKRKREPVFQNKLDIKRAYIIDAILDKPKWSDRG